MEAKQYHMEPDDNCIIISMECNLPDANDDFEVVLHGPLDVLVEVELAVLRQVRLRRIMERESM